MKRTFTRICASLLVLGTSIFSCTPIRHYSHLNTTIPAVVEKSLYLDREFNSSEQRCVLKAVNEWNQVSRGAIRIKVKHVTTYDDLPEETNANDIIVTKSNSNSIQVMRIDRKMKPTFVAHAYYESHAFYSQIILVSDRISSEEACRVVMLHEIGHALGLSHDEGESIMHPFIIAMNPHVTNNDIINFCIKNKCAIDPIQIKSL